MDQPGASPQLEDGYTRIADELVDALACTPMPASVSMLVWFVIRRTYGFRVKTARIYRSELAALWGLKERRVRQVIREALDRNLLVKEGWKLGIQKDFTLWKGYPNRQETMPVYSNRQETRPSQTGRKPCRQTGRKPCRSLETRERVLQRLTTKSLPPYPPLPRREREILSISNQHRLPAHRASC